MSGVFGYELDLTKLSAEACAAIRQQVAFYKEVRRLVQFGDLYRLQTPYQSAACAWSFVAKDKSEALVTYLCIQCEPNPPVTVLKLSGLDPSADYQIAGRDGDFGGDELMYAGLTVPRLNDLQSVTWRLSRVPPHA